MEKGYLPKISVVTPSYNQGKYLEDAIISVLEQNYSNFEHIIFDNCSTDNTIDILKKYAHLTWFSEADKGQSHALNKGFSLAKGEWLVWLNADDYLLPGAIAAYTEAILRDRAVDLVYGHVNFVDAQKRLLKTVYHIPYSYNLSLYGVYAPPSSGSLFRAEFLKKNLLNEDYHYVMDSEWFLRNGNNINCVLINKVLVNFRVSGENKTAQHIKSGTRVPRHQEEFSRYRNEYVFSRWPNLPLQLKENLFIVGRKIYQILYYCKKLRYWNRYIFSKK